MYKILIIEDDTIKLREICKALETNKGITQDQIDHEVDSKSAKLKLRQNIYDLLIVDICIPAVKSGPIIIDEGIKLVEEILQRDIYKIPSHIVGLTGRSEIFEKALDKFNDQTLMVIQYNDTDIEWSRKLNNGVSQWINSKKEMDNLLPEFQYDVAIITAVNVEFEAVKNISDSWEQKTFPNDSNLYYETKINGNDDSISVILSKLPEMGMTSSAVLSMQIIHNFRPKFLFMCGIAASVQKSDVHGYGDIMVIDESWDGGAGKIIEAHDSYDFEPTAKHLRADGDISNLLRILQQDTDLLRKIKDDFKQGSKPNTELSIHIGSVVSVAGVIANKKVSDELKKSDRKLLGLEMEAYGMYYSGANCSNPKPKTIALKSVCDYADNSKNDKYQAYAAHSSAQVLYFLLAKYFNRL